MEQENELGVKPIKKLLWKLAIPAITAQIVNVLYNVVDRIYIGHIPEVGKLALTGVGVCMPLIMLISAFAMLAGMGGAPRASIMLGRNDAPGVWYPMYSYTNSLTSNTQAGQTLERMDEVKHRWLPQVILAQNFEETWNSYMEAYNACDPQSYFEDLQKELNQRMNKKNSNFCILNDKN